MTTFQANLWLNRMYMLHSERLRGLNVKFENICSAVLAMQELFSWRSNFYDEGGAAALLNLETC